MAFRFRLLTKDGRAPADMAFYMGMLGHAAFVKTDGTVFAHVHPNGSVSMAALMLAQQPQAQPAMDMPGMDHSGMHMEGELPNEVAFPYGFPSAGRPVSRSTTVKSTGSAKAAPAQDTQRAASAVARTVRRLRAIAPSTAVM